MNFDTFLNVIGFSSQKRNFREVVLSAAGGFAGIFGIMLSSYWLLGADAAVVIVPSMGASAVLLFAAPHAQFSQPWNLVGGHAVSAVIGVAWGFTQPHHGDWRALFVQQTSPSWTSQSLSTLQAF